MIKALHPDISGNPSTYITAKALSAQAVLLVQNASEFSVNDFVVVGNSTEELSEIRKISIISGKTITLSANLNNTHSENTKITIIKYDQVKFYKADSFDGTYNLVSTKDISIDERWTLYDESGALSTDYFKIRYYNSQTTDLSVFSDAITSGGFPDYALISIQDAFLEEAQDTKQKKYSRAAISRWVNDCKNDAFNKLAETNEKYNQGYQEISLVDGTAEYPLEEDFKKEQMVQVSYDGTQYERARKQELENTDPNREYLEKEPRWYFRNYKIGIRPTPTTSNGKIKLWYEAHPVDLKNDSDELPRPLNRYMDMVFNYLWYRALRQDKKFSEARIYLSEYESRREEFIEESNNLVLDENRHITEDGIEDEYDELATY